LETLWTIQCGPGKSGRSFIEPAEWLLMARHGLIEHTVRLLEIQQGRAFDVSPKARHVEQHAASREYDVEIPTVDLLGTKLAVAIESPESGGDKRSSSG
jgi:hypothetical protein